MLIIGLLVVVLAAGVWAYSRFGKSQAVAIKADAMTPVVLSQIREMVFEDRVDVSGNVEAKNTAIISARIPGTLDEIFVDEGDKVQAGQKLFQTDKIKLGRAMESARQQVAVAAAAVRASQATVERINADLAKVRIDFERYKRLYEKDHAVTKNALESQESHLKQVQAALAEANAGLELAAHRKVRPKAVWGSPGRTSPTRWSFHP